MPLTRLNNKVRLTSLLLALLALLVFSYTLINASIAGREAALRAGEVDTMNIANSLSTHVKLSFRAADMLLQEMSELYGDGRLSDAAFQRLMEKLMTRQGALFPEMDSVQIIDESGRLRHRWPGVGTAKPLSADGAAAPATSQSAPTFVTGAHAPLSTHRPGGAGPPLSLGDAAVPAAPAGAADLLPGAQRGLRHADRPRLEH